MQVASTVWSAPKAQGAKSGRGDRRIVGLVSIVVDQDVRQQGLGRVLMSETMSFYHEVGFDYVLLQQRDIGSGRSAVCATCTCKLVRRSGRLLECLLRILRVRVPLVWVGWWVGGWVAGWLVASSLARTDSSRVHECSPWRTRAHGLMLVSHGALMVRLCSRSWVQADRVLQELWFQGKCTNVSTLHSCAHFIPAHACADRVSLCTSTPDSP